MIINLGKKIRELRKARNISQEVLAQFLGVSFQAVSKWENDTAMPDVTLIPVLASFFEVSTDELFDYDRLAAEHKVEQICLEAYQYRTSDPAKSETILRDGLKQFPGNDIILNNLLYTMSSPERSEEIITLCKTLIECTHDDSVKYDAIRILADTYHQIGQQAFVEPALKQIPEIYFTKLEQMALLLEGEKSLLAAQKQLGISLDTTIDMLLVMRDRLNECGQEKEAARHERIAREILEIFEEEEGRTFHDGIFNRWCKERLERLK